LVTPQVDLVEKQEPIFTSSSPPHSLLPLLMCTLHISILQSTDYAANQEYLFTLLCSLPLSKSTVQSTLCLSTVSISYVTLLSPPVLLSAAYLHIFFGCFLI
ncbi:hypothetical protein Ancab_024726, partial [Ancistrocladus abbreviatus]